MLKPACIVGLAITRPRGQTGPSTKKKFLQPEQQAKLFDAGDRT